VVIAALKGPPNFWNEEQIRHNVLRKYAADQVNGTSFDKDSIMLYFFPKEWTLNGVATKENEVLSATDKLFIAGAKMYPGRGTGPVDATVLKVGAARTNGEIGKSGEEDLYSFNVSTGGRYVVDTRGTTDVVMKLFGPNGRTNLIKEDDDSGIGSNALISANLIPGEYFVQIRHFNPSRTGKYSVAVRKV
jgi:Bacterial pre-peptidase C-terminal domain